MDVDLLIVGGGINGAGIARDAAGRGLSVILVEKDDLASHTSSASSKLVHGGLRYLEQLQFRLVRESLAERERLLLAAPHIVEPLQFVLPLGPQSRPSWMLRAGLLLYDNLGERKVLPPSRAVRLQSEALGEGLRPTIASGFTYWDCRVHDSRLVVLNAVDAAERGATILTHTELVDARRDRAGWTATVRGPSGRQIFRSSVLVNASGPWAARLFDRLTGVHRKRRIHLLKGSHIVVPRLYDGDHAFILQNSDTRVVFAIPFEEAFTLVGTTEVPCSEPSDRQELSEEEASYLIETIGRNFTRTVSRRDIVWSYSGQRALVEDGSTNPSRATRDYVLELDADGAPLLNVFGGKLTTYRRLAERALDRMASFLPRAEGRWTEHALLPGGNIPGRDMQGYSRGLAGRYPALPAELLRRLARSYGTLAERLLDGVDREADLGAHFGAGLYAREVDYLVANEWARFPDDILFRRTKLGLRVSAESAKRLSAYLGA